jgi:hypothetical protein
MSLNMYSNTNVCASWDGFVSEFYEQRPCVLDLAKLGGPPFEEAQALDSIRIAFDRDHGHRLHSSKERRIHLNNISVDEPFIGKDLLPRPGDDFGRFIERYFSKLKAEDLTVVLHNCHHYAPSIYKAARAFLLPLQHRVGIPSGFVGTDMFAGKYRTNPKGLHKDTGAVFMFPLINEKTMAVWPWEHFSAQAPDSRYVNASVKVAYEEHLPSATMLTAQPGQAIYFPSHWWHLAYSDTLAPTLALNITWYMPTTARDFLLPVVERALRSPDLQMRFDHMPLHRAGSYDEAGIVLPSPIAEFMETLDRSFKYYVLQRASSGGFLSGSRGASSNYTEASSVRLVDSDFQISCISQEDGALALIAEGQVLRTQHSAHVVEVVRRLNDGVVMNTASLASHAGLLELLGELARIGAVEFH